MPLRSLMLLVYGLSVAWPGYAAAQGPSHRRSFASDYVARLDTVALAAGLASLRQSPIPHGTEELRLWIGGALGWPQSLYRLVRQHGHTTGSWIRYWYEPDTLSANGPEVRFGDLMRYVLSGQCNEIRRLADAEVCHTKLSPPPDWNAVIRRLEAEEVFTLVDQAELPFDSIISFDGWGLTVEARRGKDYRAYHYSNPQVHKQLEARQAEAIAEALWQLQPLLPPSDNTRVFRGLYVSGPRRNEFIACGSKIVWGIQGNLGSHSGWASDSLADTLRHPIKRLYVEARGMLAFRGLPRLWGSPYPEIVQVDSILRTWPSRPSDCH